MTEFTNPYQPPATPIEPQAKDSRPSYTIVSDTVTGPNLRLKDNVIQAIAIFVCLVLGALIGGLIANGEGAVVGGFIGLLVGLLGSGIFLMIYRAVMHMHGRHD
jgi:hypothetical protein